MIKIAKMKKGKCFICNKKPNCNTEKGPICFEHFVSEFYIKSKGCMEVRLDQLIDDMLEGKEISKEDKELLKEIKRQSPETAEEFSRLFDEI